MKLGRVIARTKIIASALIGLGIITVPLSASALTIDINTYVAGSPASGNATVATLTLTQNGANVDFNLSNSVNNLPGNIGDDAYISQLLFSYDTDPLLTSASFLNFGGTQSIYQVHIDPSGTNADYDFYLELEYPKSAADRFINGEFTTWTISNVAINDFLGSVSGSGAGALAMVHIQQVGAGSDGKDSLKYVGSVGTPPPPPDPQNPVPEPASLALMGIGLLSLGVMRKRKK
ncbi:MAG: PEP-CTERM sorting domain-containing protein [Nitrosospira sp.]|nr:PEP-CTERM sorting domain-containing protein [Nitrosospira sp.]